ncbi:sphingomyelin phosphodiesterase 1 [Drosophila tropicalis]|uniref:sphingomyelin phosphodiesterase 1 n=1 Tax=Drosophila tropicalis TaxID=46794 RepID=UPI0035ABAFC1
MKVFWNLTLVAASFLVLSSALIIPGIPTSLTTDERLNAIISAAVAEEISHEYLKYLKTGVETPRLRELADELGSTKDRKDIFTESLGDLSRANQFLTCTMCRSVVNVIARTFTSPDGELNGPNRDEEAKNVILSMAAYFNIMTDDVVGGLFDLNWPIWDYILNETIAESRSFCGMLPYEICQIEQGQYNLSVTIVGDTPAESNTELAERSDNDVLILQLTDIHYDPDYKVGGQAVCEEPMCCRNDLPAGANTTGAGAWGDYRNCDTPSWLIRNAFGHISRTHKLDWIYHTGDVPPHNIWSTTKQGNLDMLTEIDGLLTENFPNIPVYSCLGNHEPHPTNVFVNENDIPAELNVDWLYSHVWSLWSKWLPASAEETVLRGGYYTVLPATGPRIIALNSMDCYLFNWWLYYNGSLVLEQLNWFHDTLLEAERNGEKVHVLTHIPSGDGDCWKVWAREYNRIVARFCKTITGIFNGHTHKDEMNVHYTSDNHAFAVSWNGGSLTTYSYMNPNYRLYELSAQTWQVLDHHTYIVNLTEANLNPDSDPEWLEEYSFTKEFTSDTSPAGIDKLLVEMAEKPSLLRTFWKLKVTSADPKLEAGCDNACLSTTLCRIATTNYGEKTRCRELQAILEESLANEEDDDDDNGNDDDNGGGASAIMAYSFTCLLTIWLSLSLLI